MFHQGALASDHGRSRFTRHPCCGWVLAIVGVTPLGANPSDEFTDTAMRWMMTMPAGYLVIASGIMHTVFAR